jgi:hypothetical protein
LEREYSGIDLTQLDKVPVPRELTLKYEKLAEKCKSIKDRLRESNPILYFRAKCLREG